MVGGEEKSADGSGGGADTAAAAAPRKLTPEAERALAEAAERRRARDAEVASRPREIGGRSGPDPTRYGDWENGGIASDF